MSRPIRYTESVAAVVSLFFCSLFFLHIPAFVSINPPLSSPHFLTLTQFPTPRSLSPHYICCLPRCYTITPVSLTPPPPTLQSNLFFLAPSFSVSHIISPLVSLNYIPVCFIGVDLRQCFPTSLSHCWSFSFPPLPFLSFSRNGWQPPTCSSLWTGLTPSETSSSRTPKCCARTSMPSLISLWVAGKRHLQMFL